ncbi:hypothetical protein B5V88_17190 [Heyndrickxia sporothermodurans]|uniref:hypothetical protein n=1 Tax=Heyndrickxia sporothermodurans TaxID=46224 RepID=UPI000D3A5668|nr:hypothetical protein [Heyndrickxia sporothermodurans]PTY73299.1 hypothetical protein B5V88_17190 [Heyndrickxia sporothermodurans]PTY75737.1 hypothetical protein B5V89_19775 [Heyndrickxia sporothermodurans]PTY82544.1 hypothetical protein B5V91_19365 [Heyndrickxia sporothermodurans]PTY84394.1 hypothetical protein B5V90_15335 [Heyndrickxia sporothermodurans]
MIGSYKYIGETSSGIKIEMFLKKDGSIAVVLCNRKIHSFAAGNAENCNLTWSLYGHDYQAKKPAVSRAGFAKQG